MMSNNKKRIVVVGATSSIAEHCARLWVKNTAVDLVLVGRDIGKTEMVAADLRARSPESNICSFTTDFLNPQIISDFVRSIVKAGAVDIALIAHGSLPDQQECQKDLGLCNEALLVNGVSPVLFAEAFAGHMQEAGAGTLALIGSVAGDRGRTSNYVYGAAKGLMTRYAQGLQHRFADSNVRIVLVKPGPTDTPMTAHLRQQGGRLAKVHEVAETIVQGIKRGTPVIYAPMKWAIIMMVIRHLPRFIFNKMDI